MNPDDVTKALISVIKDVQMRAGLTCPDLGPTSVPPKIVPKFDSTVWPAVTTLVARKLEINIPNDVHIFGGEKGKPLLSINESATLICTKAQIKAPEKMAA
jgi:hypothetical protein